MNKAIHIGQKGFDKAETIIDNYLARNPGLVIVEGMPERDSFAMYFAQRDEITIRPFEDDTFRRDADNYFSTLFHEIAHSTGHPDRMDREIVRRSMLRFATGTNWEYNFEEMIAEHASSFLDEEAGITSTRDHHALYLRDRIYEVQAAPHEVAEAARIARDVTEYILGHESDAAALAMRLVA